MTTDIKGLLALIDLVDAEIPIDQWKIPEDTYRLEAKRREGGKELTIFQILPDRILRDGKGKPIIQVDEWGQHPDVVREWDAWNAAFLRLVLAAPAAVRELAARLEVLGRAAADWKAEWVRGAPRCVPDLPGEKALWDALEAKEAGQ